MLSWLFVQQFFNFGLNFFGSCAGETNHPAFALRTFGAHFALKIAVMAAQNVAAAMKSQRYIAVFAAFGVAAFEALHISRKTAPIEKQNRLFAARHDFAKFFFQAARERRQNSHVRFAGHVHDFDFGHHAMPDALRHADVRKFAARGAMITFEARRGRTQNDNGVF